MITMKTRSWKPYLKWILLSEAVGVLSGWISREGTQTFSQTAVQPPLSPPAILFPIVWTILYALMGISAARVSLESDSPARNRGLNLFVAQLIINFFWSPLFFNAQAYGSAFLWILLLIALVIAMILSFRKVDPLAAWLQIPYLLWLLFAAYLNYGVWQLNS
jgi:tryptophan-rich sensory protein